MYLKEISSDAILNVLWDTTVFIIANYYEFKINININRQASVKITNMKNGDYYITQEQLETIEHYKRMFEVNAETIQNLCDSEKDDIVYGFELGKMHSHLRDCFIEMMELEDEIRKQQILNKGK